MWALWRLCHHKIISWMIKWHILLIPVGLIQSVTLSCSWVSRCAWTNNLVVHNLTVSLWTQQGSFLVLAEVTPRVVERNHLHIPVVTELIINPGVFFFLLVLDSRWICVQCQPLLQRMTSQTSSHRKHPRQNSLCVYSRCLRLWLHLSVRSKGTSHLNHCSNRSPH